MPYISDSVFDNGLSHIRNGGINRSLHITTDEVVAFAELSTKSLGEDTDPNIGAPSDSAGGGREVAVSALGATDGTGSATGWCIVDTAESEVLISGPLTSTVAITASETFSLSSFTIRIPDPA